MALLLKFIKTLCAAIIVKKQGISATASVGLAQKIHAKVDALDIESEILIVGLKIGWRFYAKPHRFCFTQICINEMS
jgi:hypothetical protein